jgi:tetratricopeptide (TPR) repeat protein
MRPALAFARQIVELADRHDDTTYRLLGYRALGATQLTTGQNRAALESLQRAEKYSDPARQKLLSYRFGFDPGLAVLCYKTWALMFLGLHKQAEQVRKRVSDELANHSHAPTFAICTMFASVWPELAIGNFEACELHSAELVTFSAERKLESSRLLGAKFYTCARAMREPTPENIAASHAAMDAEHRTGTRIFDSAVMSRLAEALLTSGDATAAETALQEAFAFVDQSGERFWLADLHRVQGQIALKRPEADGTWAEACFLKTIEIARSQEARMLELRAATDLARLWRDTGSNHDPRALIEPILAVIEGGETTRDVRNARALLAEIV